MSETLAARNAVVVSFFLNGATFATWVSRLPEVRHRLDLSNGELGTVLLAGSIAALLGLTGAGGPLESRGGASAAVPRAPCGSASPSTRWAWWASPWVR